MSRPTPEKRLYIKTYGCQMNVYDSERMADVLVPLGYGMVDSPEGADLVVLNTCHIREKATEKVYSELGRLKELRKAQHQTGGSRLGIVVAGCVAQAEGEEIMRRQPAVDLVVGPQALSPAARVDRQGSPCAGRTAAVAFAPEEKFDALPSQRHPSGVTAFLTVQEGCDKFCTFCVVPYTRGGEWSRSPDAIEAEAARPGWTGRARGHLLGQNVNAYAGEGGLAALIPGWRNPGDGSHPLHHQPSTRHG